MDDYSTNSAPAALPVDGERLRDFDRILRRYKAGKAGLERRVVQAEQWWKLRNDAAARRDFDLAADRDFESRSGWLHNVLVSKHADAMENYPEALILPREPGDRQQARLLSSIVPCVLEQADFESTYASAWWRKLKTGTAVYHCAWDPEALNGLGEIVIRDVDLLSVFWEPGVRDIQDSRCFFHVELQDDELLERRYPRLRGKLKGSAVNLTRFIYDDAVSTEGKSPVIDVYYKQDGVLHFCKYVGDEVLYSTENEEAGAQETGTPSVSFADTSLREGGMLPERRGLYDDGLYPFVFDPLFPIEGSPCGYGYVDLCKNSQTAIDLLRSAFLKNVKAGATPRYFARSDGAVNEQELLDLTKPVVHVSGSLDEQFLRPIQSAGLPGNYVAVYESLIAELRETSGNTQSANGLYSAGVTAASSIAALQEASGKTSRDSSRASYRAFRKLIGMVIERIRQFYELPRQFRITGQGGEECFVAFDNALLRPRAIGLGDTDLGFTQPVFDIRVEVQKRNAYTRTSQNELAIQLMGLGVFNPALARQSLMMLDMMDFDGKDRVKQALQVLAGESDLLPAGDEAPDAPVGRPWQRKLPGPARRGEEEPTFMRAARERANRSVSL